MSDSVWIWFEKNKWLLLTALAVAFSSAAIHFSEGYGRLVFFPYPDDSGYMADALMRLDFFHRKGLWKSLQYFWEHPPHSVWSTILAMGSFLLFGKQVWAPYAGNTLLIVILLFFCQWLLKNIGWWARLLAIGFVLAIPFTTLCVTEFRPDPFWGIAMAVGAVLLCLRPITRASLAYRLAIALAFGLSLLIKPTTAPATLALFMGVLVIQVLVDCCLNRAAFSPHLYVRPVLAILGGALLIALPYYLVAGDDVYLYIDKVLFGKEKAIWSMDRHVGANIGWYFNGPAAQINFGKRLIYEWILFLFFAGGLVLSRLGNNAGGFWLLVRLGLVTFLFLMVPSLTIAKNHLLGSIYTAMLIFTGLLSVEILLSLRQVLPRSGAIAISTTVAGALLFGILNFRWPVYHGNEALPEEVRHANQLGQLVYRTIRDHHVNDFPVVHMTMEGPLYSHSLWLQSLLEGRNFTVHHFPELGNLKQTDVFFSQADFILAQEAGAPGTNRLFPVGYLQGDLLKRLEQRKQFVLLRKYTAYNGKGLYLYRRQGAFQGVRVLSGLTPVFSGQETRSLDGYLGSGERNTFELIDDVNRPGYLSVAGKLHPGVRGMRILLNGSVLQVIKFDSQQRFFASQMQVPPLQDVYRLTGQSPQLVFEYTFDAGKPVHDKTPTVFLTRVHWRSH